MTTLQPDSTKILARRPWNIGVRGRLLFAFFAIAAFSILAAAASIYAFREVGDRLDVVEKHVPPAVSALELSRSAERIIAAAPALLAAPDRSRRDEVKATLVEEVRHLDAKLLELIREGAPGLPLERIQSIVSALTTSLGELDAIVARRLEASEEVRVLRHQMYRTNSEVRRLLTPWLNVTDSEIATLVEGGADEGGDQLARLNSLIKHQKLVQTAQRRASAVTELLAAASTSEEAGRFPVLNFQLGLTLDRLETTTDGLDPRLRRLLLEQVERFRKLAQGPDSIIDARRRELALGGEGETRIAATTSLSADLTAAVDRLGRSARQDIGEAIGDALSVQRRSTRALIAVVFLSVVTSLAIVWFYVGGSIARRLTALSDGMLAIAGGRLRSSVAVKGSDEIAAMAQAVEIFRRNAIELEELLEERKQTAARLEHLVAERTRELSEKSRQLEVANKNKSHFLASASHDLRQPLHALNLFVAQLRVESDSCTRDRLVDRINVAVSTMSELFASLLDLSKLEAGVVEPDILEFPIGRVLDRIETTFSEAARQKGLRLSVVHSSAWVRSDPVLMERILMNLVSNAVRCTARGGVVVGCRRRSACLRIDVCDSGPGIPIERQQGIFGSDNRLAASRLESGGLGLIIVERMGRLLDHAIEIGSQLGRGSRFCVSVPFVAEPKAVLKTAIPPAIVDPTAGKLVVVIDDDPLVLESMGGILRNWGCRLLTANSEETALSRIQEEKRLPDLIISDYRLANGATGIQAIEQMRREFHAAIPAFLISGDTAPEGLREARDHGIHLLHKPVPPMQLRAILGQLLKPHREAGA